MSFVRTFENVTPPKRDDNVPFTRVTLKENSVPTYPMAQVVESFELVPTDSNPASPAARNFTTSLSTIQTDAYNWLVWEDAAGATYVSGPFQNSVNLSPLEIRVRSHFPRTWEALAKDEFIGIDTLRLRIEDVKAVSLPALYAQAQEVSYPSILLVYIAKKCVLELIPPAIEYWMRQKTAISNTGTNETSSFTDPVIALKDLARRLTVEVATLATNPDLTIYMRVNGSAPAVSGTGDLVTANPFEFDPAFASDVTVGNPVI